MKSTQQWLNEYGVNHQDRRNKLIHWICVALIFFSILGMLYPIKLHVVVREVPLTAAHIALLGALIFYVLLSSTLTIGMTIIGLIVLTICNLLETVGFNLWRVSLLTFILAWIGQFIGHKLEGSKPSFLKDIQFLLICPIWLLSFVYKKWGIRID